MKKIISLFVSLSILGSVAFAQAQQSTTPKTGKMGKTTTTPGTQPKTGGSAATPATQPKSNSGATTPSKTNKAPGTAATQQKTNASTPHANPQQNTGATSATHGRMKGRPSNPGSKESAQNEHGMPMKKDGTPDMRYKANRQAQENKRGMKKDGTPDMRRKENRQNMPQ